MSILVDKNTRVVVQGITGNEGMFHTRQMIAYGTQVVAGVTPGKGGQEIEGLPVYDRVEQAVRERGANASILFVPARFALDAMVEAAEAGTSLLVCITEGVPVHDMLRALPLVQGYGARLIGPNCPGVISPGKAKLGIMPGDVFNPGPVGIISRSGTLTYEIAHNLSQAGLGQSTVIGIGGDAVVGSTYADLLPLIAEDEETEALVLVGEIGGTAEEEAADWIAERLQIPVVAYIAGFSAPPGKRMGHAGAIISAGEGTAEAKAARLEGREIPVARTPAQVSELLEGRLP
ncbi:MAG: succinate--CoA ligase subunit alpha [Candidatus Bipolaricaulota bacterium]